MVSVGSAAKPLHHHEAEHKCSAPERPHENTKWEENERSTSKIKVEYCLAPASGCYHWFRIYSHDKKLIFYAYSKVGTEYQEKRNKMIALIIKKLEAEIQEDGQIIEFEELL